MTAGFPRVLSDPRSTPLFDSGLTFTDDINCSLAFCLVLANGKQLQEMDHIAYTLSGFSRVPMDCSLPGSSDHVDSPGKNT